MSLTVILNIQVAGLPAPSVTMQLTRVSPTGNTEPLGGLQAGTTVPGQLSVTVGAAYVTTAEHLLKSVGRVRSAGQVMVGAWVSLTVMVKEQAPPISCATQLTVVVPTGKNEPCGGVQVIVPQVPMTVGGG